MLFTVESLTVAEQRKPLVTIIAQAQPACYFSCAPLWTLGPENWLMTKDESSVTKG